MSTRPCACPWSCGHVVWGRRVYAPECKIRVTRERKQRWQEQKRGTPRDLTEAQIDAIISAHQAYLRWVRGTGIAA